MRNQMESMVTRVQAELCGVLERLDGGRFESDPWSHGEGGGGESRVLQGGRVVEKAGVNVASVWGTLPADAEQVMIHKEDLPPGPHRFAAVGLSVVIHPRSPRAPIVHCNYRYFELEQGRWWFGGGADLTPIYVVEDDVRHFHRAHRAACDRHDASFYPRFKPWCDDYFRIPHRGEARGVGGIFFDDLRDRPREELFAFVTDCAETFGPAYTEILERRMDEPYGEAELRWQALRRSRYVEFNLMYDRGTRFGLRTGGRVESILMSMPPTARWEYRHLPEPGSAEAATAAILASPREWT